MIVDQKMIWPYLWQRTGPALIVDLWISWTRRFVSALLVQQKKIWISWTLCYDCGSEAIFVADDFADSEGWPCFDC